MTFTEEYTSLAPAWRPLHALLPLPGMLFLQRWLPLLLAPCLYLNVTLSVRPPLATLPVLGSFSIIPNDTHSLVFMPLYNPLFLSVD